MLNLLPIKRSRFFPDVVDRVFDDPFFRFFEERPRLQDWSPAVEIHEDESEIRIQAELPGLEQKDVSIEVHDGTLTFSGERAGQRETKGECIRSERWYGKFSRTFSLPQTADLEKVSAALKNGLLTITVPKKEEAKPRKIDVQIS